MSSDPSREHPDKIISTDTNKAFVSDLSKVVKDIDNLMSIHKLSYYEILGINQSATADEIRRAYRILARRYHPDLNPGKSSEERFKQISVAYEALSDPDKRRAHDSELDAAKKIKAGFAAYEKAQKHSYSTQRPKKPAERQFTRPAQPEPEISINDFVRKGINRLASAFERKKPRVQPLNRDKFNKPLEQPEVKARNVSVVELSVNTMEAISGIRKSIEVNSGGKVKKISAHIPSGVRTGSVLRLNASGNEDYILILKVAPHPVLELAAKGLIVNLQVSIQEALFGANIKVPGLDGIETINIPAGSQSGDEIRLIQKGIKFESGQRGDLFYRLLIQIPSSYQAVGIEEKVKNISEYYESTVRAGLPTKLTEL